MPGPLHGKQVELHARLGARLVTRDCNITTGQSPLKFELDRFCVDNVQTKQNQFSHVYPAPHLAVKLEGCKHDTRLEAMRARSASVPPPLPAT